MYQYSISILKNELEALKRKQLSVAEDCRDGVKDPDSGLVDVFSLQSKIFDLEDGISLLEDVNKELKNSENDESVSGI